MARLLADELGWHLLDSGALYRLTALAAMRRAIPLGNSEEVTEVAAGLAVQFPANGGGEARIILDDEDVTTAIRSETCGDAASRVAAIPTVRDALLERQRRFRRAPGLVADGRDMGTVVFADADVKIFLTASAEERARRRYKQLSQKGINASLAPLVSEIAERDRRDTERAVAPLRPAPGAHLLDSTGLAIHEVKDMAMHIVRAQLLRR